MYLRYILYLTLWILAMLLGPIGYFIARYAHIGKSIWGNNVDGWTGGTQYQNNEAQKWFRKPWSDFWWSVVRNPANNLVRKLSAKGKVLSTSQQGNLKIVTMTTGSKFFFYHTPNNRIMLKIGWKLWNSSVIVGRKINAKLAFSAQRGSK